MADLSAGGLNTAQNLTREPAAGLRKFRHQRKAAQGKGSLMALRKIKDRLIMAVLVVAIVALTGGWVYALGWIALKLI
jgi:hypothetical protein